VLIIPSSWDSQLDGDLHQHRAASISTKNNLRSCKEIKKSSISIRMGITFKHRVDATQLRDTISAKENFLRINLRTNTILP
jgi:hypothetical protein